MTKIEITVVENKDEESCKITVNKVKQYRTTTKQEITTSNYVKALIDNVLSTTTKGN